MKAALLRFGRDRRGATAIEYALIAGLVSTVIVVALTSIGPKLNGKFTNVQRGLQ